MGPRWTLVLEVKQVEKVADSRPVGSNIVADRSVVGPHGCNYRPPTVSRNSWSPRSVPGHRCPKSNMSNRSPIAGMLVGMYGELALMIGLGRLSRLRSVSGFSSQLRSMNFTTEA